LPPKLAPLLLVAPALLSACDDPGPKLPPGATSSRLPAGAEALARPRVGDAVKLKGFADDPKDPRGRGTIPGGARVVVVDDSLQDLFHNIPGSRDVLVKPADGGPDARPVFIARTDLVPASPAPRKTAPAP
jgi:hypothetical protein